MNTKQRGEKKRGGGKKGENIVPQIREVDMVPTMVIATMSCLR